MTATHNLPQDVTRTVALTVVSSLIAVTLGVLAAAFLSFADAGATTAGNAQAPVTARLSRTSDQLCAGQAWPNFSEGCRAWISAASDAPFAVRAVSTTISDRDHQVTIAGKAEETVILATR